jgi:hypothetical protein
MSILAISRHGCGTPDIVSMQSTDVIKSLTAARYLDRADIIRDILIICGEDFIWQPTDLVMICYSPDTIGFFRYDEANRCFIAN